ncbi:hypothetical protein M9991_13585 [Chryseobacterium gallinarum]|uniref:hypothetical protein n=1 Tax=Chryseobacterium gallinarum TaxID=1324352 RepID=UPI002023E0E6|nr:hypothetical protein [Chryseobacterium gallinarum]MCL8537898.1 hypothetical protein [Chryseobacterium gallinarum]
MPIFVYSRFCFSDRRIHEIADEFGFADESYINQFFKGIKGKALRLTDLKELLLKIKEYYKT